MGKLLSVESGPNAEYLRQKAARYLVKDSSLYSFFHITDSYMEMYAIDEDSEEKKVECRVYFDEAEDFVRHMRALKPEPALSVYRLKGTHRLSEYPLPELSNKEQKVLPTLEKPLLGKRIALDPGHVGGSMSFARTEDKFIMIRAGSHPDVHREISFNEGNLTLLTAEILKEKLEAAGATVLLSREGEGLNARGLRWSAWKSQYAVQATDTYIRDKELHDKDSTWWKTKAGTGAIFKGPFLWDEFHVRAARINAFGPDLTLVLHYNVDEDNEPARDGYREAVPYNYSMTFIPGAFMKGELDRPEDRMYFLLKLLSDDVEESRKAAAFTMGRFSKDLGVPVVSEADSASYLDRACLPAGKDGVFARNLAMTRMIQGPLVYGEPLLQDNVQECQRLSEDRIRHGEHLAPERVIQTATAYYQAVLDYFEEKQED